MNLNMNNLDNQIPYAFAEIRGNNNNPLLNGFALFRKHPMGGLLIQVEVFHLPDQNTPDSSGFFGMHIHENGNCSLPFDQTGNHYNPTNQLHPYHAGDLPPLLSNNGYAWMEFYDARLTPDLVSGKSLILHRMPDNFTSQPSGDSGDKIGCGVIVKLSSSLTDKIFFI